MTSDTNEAKRPDIFVRIVTVLTLLASLSVAFMQTRNSRHIADLQVATTEKVAELQHEYQLREKKIEAYTALHRAGLFSETMATNLRKDFARWNTEGVATIERAKALASSDLKKLLTEFTISLDDLVAVPPNTNRFYELAPQVIVAIDNELHSNTK